MIDLHLHTTASDGRSTPDELVHEAAAAGVRILAVTDHDTIAAVSAVAKAAHAAGLVSVPGIEITAVHRARDVHVLGYFVNITDIGFAEFLRHQRDDRRRRVVEIADRLDRLGLAIDRSSLVTDGEEGGRALGRPLVACALVEAGHVQSVAEAFDRYLAEGRPAFVERIGSSPADVIARVRRAGGVASLAHPGKLNLDDIIPGLADDGLTAIEVFHPDHDDADVVRYGALASSLHLLVTGGSDYHGPGTGRVNSLGRVGMPAENFEALERVARAQPG